MSELTDLAAKPLVQQKLSPIVQDQLDQLAKNTAQMPDKLAQGLATDKSFLTPGAALRKGSALGGDDQTSAVLGALGARNQRRSDDFVNTMKRGIELNAPAIKQAGYAQQAQDLTGIGQVNNNNYKILQQQNMNRQRIAMFEQQQKQSLIGGILGVVGTVVGAVGGFFVGGPVGAAAGAAGGGALGGAVGKAAS